MHSGDPGGYHFSDKCSSQYHVGYAQNPAENVLYTQY